MIRFGYHASHEQHPPSVLLEHVRHAAARGFDAAMCSDHFHPWTDAQGQSGFAWSWLGAALQATPLTFGVVSAPGWRYHPAVIAQATATLDEMFPDRFWLAVGSGEALNEGITGLPWPERRERNRHLKECVDVMRALWRGETVTHRGRVTTREARLYTLPARPPLLFAAALSPETAEFAGEWADGLITVGGRPEAIAPVIEAFRRGGGMERPVRLQHVLSWAATDDEALRAAHEQWRFSALGPEVLPVLRTPRQFDDASRHVPAEAVAATVRVSSSLERHVEWLAAYAPLGVDAVYLTNVGRDQREFIDAFADAVLPALRAGAVTPAPAGPR